MINLFRPTVVIRVWIPSLLYALGYLFIDYHSSIRAAYIENTVDRLLAVPVGFITLIILPTASFIYIKWLSNKFFNLARLRCTLRTWLLADMLPWAIALFMCSVDQPLTAYTLIAGVVWSLTVLLRYIGDLARNHGSNLTSSREYIALLFFISGFSALIYQIVWQRVLFTAFGVDSESVTIIVSVFMFGLGAGALLGSWLVRFKNILLRLFLAAEVGIGIFGFFSIPAAQYLLQHAILESGTGLAVFSYVLFSIPTLFMGATLPLLVGHLDISYKNIGRSTGLLYGANTLGSALAALMTVSAVFVVTGQRGATMLAAFLNLTTAALLYASMSKLEQRPVSSPAVRYRGMGHLGFGGSAMLSAGIGFVALSGELFYYRLLGFTSGGLPHVFGWLLAAYLCGIAAGSLRVKQLYEQAAGEIRLTGAVFSAGIIILLTPVVLGLLSALSGRPFALLAGLLSCGLFGFLTGGVLPYLCNSAAGSGDREKNAALIYMFNILGAALGPLVTGYVLLEHLSTIRVAMLLALSLLIIGYCLHDDKRAVRSATIATFILICMGPLISTHFLDRLQQETLEPLPYKYVIENRVSIITVAFDQRGDIVYGGGIYDGRFNTDPLNDSNGIQRAYYSACLHPDPHRVLEIGLSSGSWARVMLSNNRVKEMTSIEINHGYGNIISIYPIVSDILTSPRLRLVYDDGRKWLRHNPTEKFDLIVMNTTFHWRSNSTNLLSREFFNLAKGHLNPGGVIYFNATGSIDAAFTVASIFKHVLKFRSFYAASDIPFAMTRAEKRGALRQYTDTGGNPIFLQAERYKRLMEDLVKLQQNDIGEELRNNSRFRVITDDNMLVEYKLGLLHAL